MERTQPPPLSRANRIGLDGITAIVTLIAGAMAALGITSVWETFRGTVSTEVPMRGTNSGTIEHSGIDLVPNDATVMFPKATTSMQWLDAIASLTWVALLILVIVTTWMLRRALVAGRPFLRSTTRLLMVLSIGLFAQGILSSVLNSFLQMHALDLLAALNFPGYEGASSGGFFITIDMIPLGIAIFLGLLAGVFQIGERMQRETEGLV